MFGIVNFTNKARNNVYARRHRQFLGLYLVAHSGNGVHWRTYERNILLGQCLCKAGAFGQKTIARMYRLCAGLLARGDDFVRNQIRLCGWRRTDMHGLICHLHKRRTRVGIGIDCDRRDPHAARGFDNPASDFATVGDQDFLEH